VFACVIKFRSDDHRLTIHEVLPFVHPRPVFAPESRRKREPPPVEIKPVEIKWTMEAEASWAEMVTELDACVTQWANGDLGCG
jgi:hypothetical protein